MKIFQGSIAYVPQQAWIQNMTLRENILFGKPYLKQTYQDILGNCCLEDDLRILVGGDMIEIGEKVSGWREEGWKVMRIYHFEKHHLIGVDESNLLVMWIYDIPSNL